MIKHRFILRGKDDFRVFAAIPAEHTVLTWEQWVRPPDWEALAAAAQAAITSTEYAIATFTAFADEVRATKHYVRENFSNVPTDVTDDLIGGMLDEIAWADHALESGNAALATLREVARVLDAGPDRVVFDEPGHKLDFSAIVKSLKAHLQHTQDPTSSLASRISQIDRNVAVYKRAGNLIERSVRARRILQYLHTQRRHTEAIQHVLAERTALAAPLDTLVSSEPGALPPCPPGVPFAAYTIEFDDTTVNVIEGKAWIDGRDATAAERAVVEIVTQMLTERALNPKSETRIPVVETDPAHATRTREADERDKTKPPAEHKLRTIKFNVSPPRYLRAAAERILSSPRRAHWVIGHWREQAHGEGHKLRRRTWIHPHIRGLGDAGAVVARVAADDHAPVK